MTPHTKRHWTLAGVWGGISAVAVGLAMFVNWTIATDEKLGASAAERDSLYAYIGTLDSRVQRLERLQRIKRRVVVLPPQKRSDGIVRRLFHIIF
jgi:hypothetical protein